MSGSQQGPNTSGGGPGGPAGQKGEVYNVRTDNILFICAGAFNGLHKVVLDRISKGSIGFGANVRAAPGTSADGSQSHETMIEGEDELFEKFLPYYAPPPASDMHMPATKRKVNSLDLIEPQDLQKYGLIPELVGRLPIACALSSLDNSTNFPGVIPISRVKTRVKVRGLMLASSPRRSTVRSEPGFLAMWTTTSRILSSSVFSPVSGTLNCD